MPMDETGRAGAGAAAVADDPSADPSQSPHAPPQTMKRWAGAAGWALVAILCLLQYGLFRQHLLREVLWSYPPNHDQVNVLQQSYLGYEKVQELGPRKGFAKEMNDKPPKVLRVRGAVTIPPRPVDMSEPPPVTKAVGILLPLEATTLYFIVGPGRLTALSLNFAYFATLQAALVGAVRWISGRWSVAFIALGLLLCALTPFFWAGGLTDFRLDFIGFCLFGTFMCAVLRSRMFADARWSIVAGLIGALLFATRFIALVYLAGAMGILAGYLVVQVWRRPEASAARRHSARQLRNVLLAGAIIAAVAVPVIAGRWRDIRDYYVVGHVTGKEKDVRAREQGVNNWRESLAFYPRSVIENHAGGHLLRWAAYLLLAGLGALAARGVVERRHSATPPFDVGSAFVFGLACLLVPLAALTADTAKSPVVGDIMVAPLVWLVVLSLIVLAAAYRNRRPLPAVRIGLIVLAVLVVREGMMVQADRELKPTDASRNRPQIEKLLGLYDRVGDDASAMGWRAPSFAFDSTSDALNFKVFAVMEFERRGRAFTPSEVMANTIFLRNPAEIDQRLACADFALLTQPWPGRRPTPYAFDREMQRRRPQLFAWCRSHLVELAHESLGDPFDCGATAFVRPAVQVRAEPDGWIKTRGATITGLAEVLRQRPHVELVGNNAAAYLKSPPRVTAELHAGSGPVQTVPAELKYEGKLYRLSLRLDPALLPREGAVTIELSFGSGFVPRQVSGTPDDRELVMRLPSDGSLQKD